MNSKFKLLPFLLMSSSLYVYGQDRDTTSIDEVMINENRLQIPFNKQSRNIQIIDRAQISKLPARSISEVLTYMSGVDVRQRGPFGTQADVSIDGGLFDQTLILLNGVKVSDIQTGHHSLNLPVSLDAVERIEVLKGPAARIYGINALTGAINIITSTNKTNNLTVNVQSGSSFQSKEEGDGKGIYAGGNAQAVVNFGNSSYRQLVSLGYGRYNGMRYNSSAEDKKIYYQSNYQINSRNEMNVMLGYVDNQFGANGFYASPGDRESYEVVKTLIGAVGFTNRISDRFVIKPRLSYRNNKDDYRYYRNDLSKARSEHETDAASIEINSLLHTRVGDFGFGLESRSEKIVSTNIGDHHRYNHGVYAEYKTEAIRNLYLNLGSYLNYNTQYGWEFFPGIDASYTLASKFKVAFNVGSSQRLPSYTDLYLKQVKNIGNANLIPENAWQYELNFRYFTANSYVQAGYFNRRIDQFIDWVSDNPDMIFQAQNLGDNKIDGINVTAGHKFKFSGESQLSFDASYNYLNPKTKIYAEGITSKYVLESLKHQAILRATYFVNKLNIGLANRWVERELNKPYFIADVKVGYKIQDFTVSIDANNIFNQSYKEVGSILLPKRWFTLGVKWKLDKI